MPSADDACAQAARVKLWPALTGVQDALCALVCHTGLPSSAVRPQATPLPPSSWTASWSWTLTATSRPPPAQLPPACPVSSPQQKPVLSPPVVVDALCKDGPVDRPGRRGCVCPLHGLPRLPTSRLVCLVACFFIVVVLAGAGALVVACLRQAPMCHAACAALPPLQACLPRATCRTPSGGRPSPRLARVGRGLARSRAAPGRWPVACCKRPRRCTRLHGPTERTPGPRAMPLSCPDVPRFPLNPPCRQAAWRAWKWSAGCRASRTTWTAQQAQRAQRARPWTRASSTRRGWRSSAWRACCGTAATTMGSPLRGGPRVRPLGPRRTSRGREVGEVGGSRVDAGGPRQAGGWAAGPTCVERALRRAVRHAGAGRAPWRRSLLHPLCAAGPDRLLSAPLFLSVLSVPVGSLSC